MKQKLKQILILLIVAGLSATLSGGGILFVKNIELNTLRQEGSIDVISQYMGRYCLPGEKPKDQEIINFAKQLPGIDDAKIETQDGVRQLVVGYTIKTVSSRTWADTRFSVECR